MANSNKLTTPFPACHHSCGLAKLLGVSECDSGCAWKFKFGDFKNSTDLELLQAFVYCLAALPHLFCMRFSDVNELLKIAALNLIVNIDIVFVGPPPTPAKDHIEFKIDKARLSAEHAPKYHMSTKNPFKQ